MYGHRKSGQKNMLRRRAGSITAKDDSDSILSLRFFIQVFSVHYDTKQSLYVIT